MTLCKALFGDTVPRCIALVGAGGKTSSVMQLADELHAQGKRVVITTTTKMHPPEDRTLLCDTPEAIEAVLGAGKIAWAGIYYNENEYKIEEVPGLLPALLETADHVIIEADGAKTKPIKMIDELKEPVIPAECGAVVAACGMTAIGQTAEAVLFRRELTDYPAEHIITPQDAAWLLQRCYAPRYAILNQCDDADRIAAAREIAGFLPDCRCVLTRRAIPIE